jgi:hypothetical protein
MTLNKMMKSNFIILLIASAIFVSCGGNKNAAIKNELVLPVFGDKTVSKDTKKRSRKEIQPEKFTLLIFSSQPARVFVRL